MQIWHNPRCSKSRATRTILEDAGVEVTERRYLDDPPTADELRAALDALDMAPWELVRMGEDVARDLELGSWDHDDPDRWIEAMVAHPRLIERPVVLTDDGRGVVGRPPERVHDLLS